MPSDLNIKAGFKDPLLTDADGNVNNLIYKFGFGQGASVYASCSMTYKNEFLIFGGDTGYHQGDARQISKVIGCRLQRVGTLAFDMRMGACTGVRDSTIYLCFHAWGATSDKKRCRFANDPLDVFTEATLSSYEHSRTSIASSNCKFKAQRLFSNLSCSS